MIFKPTGTSELLVKSIKKIFNYKYPTGKLLDLGCGCGVIGENFKNTCEVYASDIDIEAVLMVLSKNCDIKVRCGNLFEPWSGEKFDIIVDDVSGVAEDFSFHWFKGVPCAAGKDGADLVCKVLIQAPDYLNENGKLFFPIVSLSNQERILKLANSIYKITHIGHQDFPLPKELQNLSIPKEYIKTNFGIKMMWTDIYMGERYEDKDLECATSAKKELVNEQESPVKE